jgi:alpha-ketoglutarate-dependent taurine dioxygenase
MLVPLATSLQNASKITCGFLSETQKLPLVIHCDDVDLNTIQWLSENRDALVALQHTYGALLFRGFDVNCSQAFEQFVTTSSCAPMDTYLERQLKRDRVEGNVFTSTAHTKEGTIFLHNEQSFNLRFPRNIYFNCQTVAETGGATPLADTRKIFNKIPPTLRGRLMESGFLYQRNFMEHMYVNWPWAFQTQCKETAEQYFVDNNIKWEWQEKGMATLKTEQVRPVALKHPNTGESCWFNHCTAFHINTIEPMARQFLKKAFKEDQLPNQTYFGNGESIDDATAESLKQLYLEEQVTFQWEKGDVLMVDNLSVCHGRQPFSGERLVLTAMSEPCQWEDVALTA